MNRSAICLLLCAVLASSEAAYDVGPHGGPCVPKKVRVQLFGDSTQVGVGNAPLETFERGPAELLQAAMDKRFPRGAVIVIQRGASSTTSGQLLDGTDGRNREWPLSVAADITVVNHGINDLYKGVSVETYKSNLRQLSPTVYETHNPLWRVDWASESHVNAMREVAQGKPLADVYAYVQTLPNWHELTPDGVHPSAELYRLIVENVLAPAVVPLVAELRCESAH